MKELKFSQHGEFLHSNKRFQSVVNTMTVNIFKNHFFYKTPLSECVKSEADKMPKEMKQFYADLFLLTTITKVKHEYDKRIIRYY